MYANQENIQAKRQTPWFVEFQSNVGSTRLRSVPASAMGVDVLKYIMCRIVIYPQWLWIWAVTAPSLPESIIGSRNCLVGRIYDKVNISISDALTQCD